MLRRLNVTNHHPRHLFRRHPRRPCRRHLRRQLTTSSPNVAIANFGATTVPKPDVSPPVAVAMPVEADDVADAAPDLDTNAGTDAVTNGCSTVANHPRTFTRTLQRLHPRTPLPFLRQLRRQHPWMPRTCYHVSYVVIPSPYDNVAYSLHRHRHPRSRTTSLSSVSRR